MSSPGYDDHVHAADAGPTTSVSSINTTNSAEIDDITSAHIIADYRVLDAAVSFLLSNTVLVVLTGQLLTASKVVALNCS